MEHCVYESVSNKDEIILETDKTIEKSSWKPLLRQLIICSGVWNGYFTTGVCLGVPTVIIPQLRREANSTNAVSDEMASWISSVHGYASIPWFVLLFLSSWIGRKYPFLIASIMSLISYVILYCSVTTTHILIAEVLQGPLFNSILTIYILILIEYSSAKYRGLFLTMKSASFNWGTWVANVLGTFFHWRSIAVLGIVCSIYNLLLAFYMCESPSWLASKHRYEECSKAHRWIKGEDAESENELAALIKSCKNYQEKQDRENTKQRGILKRSLKTILDKAFYKPYLLGICTLCLYHTSGKMICTVYSINIIKKITSSESTAYFGMLLLDAVTVSGMYIGSGLAKHFNRRTLLMTGSLGGIFFLYTLASYLYLIKLQFIDENKYVSLVTLTLYFLFLSFGPMILCTSLYGELMPLRYRTTGMLLTGLVIQTLFSTTLKTAPLIFKTFDLHGAFVLFATLSMVLICLLYKYLPETKDKTMQEIEEHFSGPLDVKETKLIYNP